MKPSGLIQIRRYSSLLAHSVTPGQRPEYDERGALVKVTPLPRTPTALSDPLGPELLLLGALVLETGGVGPENITMELGWRRCAFISDCVIRVESPGTATNRTEAVLDPLGC